MFSNKQEISSALLFLLALCCCNLHLVGAAGPGFDPLDALIARPAIAQEWWRLFTHPFVHVSWWHLLCDSAAIVLLWPLLPVGTARRVAIFFGCALSALLCALLLSPQFHARGLCGLSGAAHGLAACAGYSWILAGKRRPDTRLLGLILLAAVLGKSMVECLGGEALLNTWHQGRFGVVIVHAHLGGVVGGAVAAFLCIRGQKRCGTAHTMYTQNTASAPAGQREYPQGALTAATAKAGSAGHAPHLCGMHPAEHEPGTGTNT